MSSISRFWPLTAPVYSSARKRWRGMSLFRQFLVASTIVPCLGMIALGFWICDRIEDGVVQSVAATSAIYTDALISPHVQELARADTIGSEERNMLDGLLAPGLTGKHITAINIWKGDTVVYSTDKSLEGRSFASTENRMRAQQGEVTVEYKDQQDSESAGDKTPNLPILEFYAPIRQDQSTKIIALAETYEYVPALQERLAAARLKSWVAVLIAAIFFIALQAIVVKRGSRTIEYQRTVLKDRVEALSQSLSENEELRRGASEANRRVSEINERFLQRLGTDLHDGPVQLLGMSLLRLDSLAHTVSKATTVIRDDANEDVTVIREAINEALDEIRSVSGGLAPPEVEHMPLSGVLEMAAKRHRRRTGSAVAIRLNKLPGEVPFPVKVCLYRFAQEGLNNAFRHASGEGQIIAASYSDPLLEVTVADSGPGFDVAQSRADMVSMTGGQGLLGLRDRVESLGGKFAIVSKPGQGTSIKACFVLNEGALDANA